MFKMAEDVHLLRDRSQPRGPIESFFHRFKWKSMFPILFLLGLSLYVTYALLRNNPRLFMVAPQQYPIFTMPNPGSIEVEGCEDGLHRFEGFPNDLDVETMTSLKIRYLILDGLSFSRSLSNWTSLESIVIEDVWIDGEFYRVYLPSLKKFIYHQYSNGKTDPYKQQVVLKEILLFDKDPSNTWDLNKDLLNLGMSIQVKIAGTTILNVEPSWGEVNINTHYCQDILQNFDPVLAGYNLTTLSLHWCTMGAEVIQKFKYFGGTISYLFLNNALPDTSLELAELIRSMPHLKELHIYKVQDVIGNQLNLDVNVLPPTLETLSLTNIHIELNQFQVGATSVKKLSLDRSVDRSVIQNFPRMFPNLTELALFNVSEIFTQDLVETVIKKMSPEVVVVTGFPSKGTLRSSLEHPTFPGEAFVMRKTPEGYNTTQLTTFEKHFYRYKNLGFDKIDTYTDYIIWDAFPK